MANLIRLDIVFEIKELGNVTDRLKYEAKYCENESNVFLFDFLSIFSNISHNKNATNYFDSFLLFSAK